MFEGIGTAPEGQVTYVVYDGRTGKIYNAGQCHVDAVKLCATSWPGSRRAIYDPLVPAPKALTDRIDVKTKKILRGVVAPGELI